MKKISLSAKKGFYFSADVTQKEKEHENENP